MLRVINLHLFFEESRQSESAIGKYHSFEGDVELVLDRFSKCEEEVYQDFITKIFRNAEKDDDFSTQIFSREGDTKSNVLLKVEAIRERISFFNNSTIRVSKF